VRVTVLGVTGLLGHSIARALGRSCEVWGVSRTRASSAHPLAGWLDPSRWLGGVDILDDRALAAAMAASAPQVVINCAGVIKQRNPGDSELYRVNARAPHVVSARAEDLGARLVHFSTDCVFSGRRGGYREIDRPDPDDAYGASKLAGEPSGEHVLTIRSSHIGIELASGPSLVDWAISRRGSSVPGFRSARYSGLVSATLGRLMVELLDRDEIPHGTFHLASTAITKDELLRRLSTSLSLDLRVESVDNPAIDRTLDGSALASRTGLVTPEWDEMLDDLARDATNYAYRDDIVVGR